MPNLKQIVFVSVFVCALFSTAAAQDSSTVKTTLTITANAAGDRVRITAPSSVVQMHVEVYAVSGEKLFDQEIRGGNVFDWHLQDGQAQRLAPGAYVCVVTAKSVSGRITQKLGAVSVDEKSASVQQAGSQQLSLPQTQAIGPVEADSSWTVAGENEPQTPTVIANNGQEGQMIRGRGALTFRLGNFFSGIDTEQMRLTEAGDLGIGTSQPQSKLDVAGTIRAQRFLLVKPNPGTGDKTAAVTQASDGAEAVQPLVGGTGTTDRLTKWTDGSNGTLGDSGITETAGGNVGVGTTSPGAKLQISSSSPPRGISQIIGTSGLTGSQIQLTQGGVDDWAFGQPAGVSAFSIWSGRAVGANGTERLRIDSSGNVGLGTTTPAGKLNVADGNIVLTDADVGHGMTDLMATNIFGKIGPISGTDGGLDLWGFSDTGAGAIRMLGIMGSSDPIDSTPAITIRADKKNGTDSQALGSLETVLQVQNRTTNLVTVLGSGNVGIGTNTPASKLDVAGDINTSNDYNIGGSRVLSVAGTNNLFAGVNAGQANAGGQNTFVGRGAGFSNIGGNNNSFFGYQAGNNNGNGSQNSFFGVQAGFQSTTGDYSSLFGYQAGFNNRGNFNSFFGGAAGTNNLAGSTNSFFGYDAGFFNTTGNSNAFFGDSSGHSNLGGNYNSFFGDVAGLSNTSGDFNTIIGAGADVSSGSLTHATAIGAQSVISTSNSIGLGRSDGSDTVYVWGLLRTGLDGTGSLDVCRNADLRLSTCSSSLRYKTGIQPFTRGLDVVRRLRPITFNWKDGGMSDIGFGAEDVEQVEPLLTTRNDQGEIEGVKYKQITTVLVNAIKEQQDQIAALQTRLRRLEQALKNRPETKRRHR